MNTFFTSDTHFSHKNIMKFCNRPFNTVEEMNESIIKTWNSKISKDDVVYHLGDFSFKDKGSQEIFDRLNGEKHLIVGNHDHKHTKNLGWESVNQYKVLRSLISNIPIVLFHYPMYSWDRQRHGSWHFFGHVHGEEIPFTFPNSKCLDVGWDGWIPDTTSRKFNVWELEEIKDWLDD